MCTFVEALYQRYSESMCEDSSIELFIVGNFSPGKLGKSLKKKDFYSDSKSHHVTSNCVIVRRFSGSNSIGNHLTLPPAISLTRSNIHKSGAENVIKDCCRVVEELDLASNNLTDLNQIFNIVKEMPYLRFLNLSENDLSEVNVDQIKAYELHNLRSLVLNNTSIPWNAITLLLDHMPNLQDLHICLNNFKTLDILPKSYNVKRIYISKNPQIQCWQQIRNLLIAFPHLKSLTMADCNIAEIPENLLKLLPKLQSLNISNLPITSWTVIDNLNSLPELIELRCQGCKILQEQLDNQELRRNHLIARLPKIKRLNGSEIIDDERLHAERHFIRYYDERSELAKPQRYYDLFNKYGAIPALAKVILRPVKCAEVTIVFRKKNENDKENDYLKGESKKLKVNLKHSVRDLKNQISGLFKLPSSRIRLFYLDQEVYEAVGPEEMKLPQKKLYTYKISDGDKFIFDDKDNI